MSKKSVIITGASGGLGASLAVGLSKLPGQPFGRIGLIARREEELKKVQEQCGGASKGCFYAVGDVTKEDQVKAAFASLRKDFGEGVPVDVLVANAGRGCFTLPSEMTCNAIDDMMKINVHSAILSAAEVLPEFKQRNAGMLLVVSSVLGRWTGPSTIRRSAYIASKHALNGWAMSLRHEMQQSHPAVKIALVSPPAVATDFGTNCGSGSPPSAANPNAQSPEDCTAAMIDQIMTGKLDVYTDAKVWYPEILAFYGKLGAE